MTIRDQEPGAQTAPTRRDQRYEAIGQSITRIDSHAKVIGATKYSTDFYPRGVLHAKVLFSDRPRARIVSIDTSRAESLAGVEAVITGDDAPDHRYGLFLWDKTILAKQEVRYVGEHVAAVAAVSEQTASEAVALIDVVYEDLPPLLETGDALAGDANLIHPEVGDYHAVNPYIRYGNVCMDARLERGDAATAMARADVVVEGIYRTPPGNHGAIEPHACVAGFDDRGLLTVWTATQQLSVCHGEVSAALGLPAHQVRLVAMGLGGGFGGKLGANLEPLCALLAQKTGQAVRLAMTREEEFFAAKARAPYKVEARIGAMQDGALVAGEFDIVADAGAYADEVVGTATHSLNYCEGVYRFPAIRGRARAVYTNNPDYGCMRGYGALQVMYALESLLNELARELGIDPAEFRLNNLMTDGYVLMSGQPVEDVRIRQTMEKALEDAGYWAKRANPAVNRGIGVSNIRMASGGLLSSSASIRLNEDGTVTVTTGAVDIGTGTYTGLTQIAAEALELPPDRVGIGAADTDSAAFDLGSIASRTLFDTGSAVRLAAEDLRRQIRQRSAEALGCSPEEVIVRRGTAFREGDADSALDYAAIAGMSMYSFGGPLVGAGSWHASKPHDPQIGSGYTEEWSSGYAFATHVAEVEVDPDTGQTRVVDYTACHDVGRAINPMAVEGQIEGGVAQGLGAGLWEEMIIDTGTIRNPNFVDYHMPTILDTPPIRVSLVQEPDPIGPFGAKGVGEHPIHGPAPAVANAIADATGVRITEIPVTPERLYELMHGESSGGRPAEQAGRR
ncbi:MAG: xanthine dehydrogenase family protein molybdopterin-binding subunit [Acidimicrobiia bacterium]|nr:xanthine dehydrogenase family protein molybdopterin-binding subunit [Acidimicrobiia bacterium]